MKFSVVAPADLDSGLCARWHALQAANPALASPYFCPGFTLAVARVRADVRVAVLEEEGAGVVGFFPYQARGRLGRPVGAPVSDHHGVVAEAGTRWHWPALLRASGLWAWDFNHLPAAQAPSAATRRGASPYLDLSGGYAAWCARRVAAGSGRVAKLERAGRRLAQERGPLRFEARVPAADRRAAVLATVLRSKGLQFQRSGLRDPFQEPWTRALLHAIADTESAGFAGRLSALYAGDTLVAAHLGMRSAWAWHYWLPVYAHAQARHSPGLLLLLRMAEAAAGEGCRMLDLGKGDDGYKAAFADAALPLAEGSVSRSSLAGAWRDAGRDGVRWLRTSAMADALRPWWKRLRGTDAPAAWPTRDDFA